MIEKLGNNNKFIGSDPLDLIKFICKEFWEEIFRKKVHSIFSPLLLSSKYLIVCMPQIDKLQTNHRGVFVLTDLRFRWLEKYSSDDIASKQAAAKMLNVPCGIIRGALANLGVLAIVNADFNNLPGCTFNIRVKS